MGPVERIVRRHRCSVELLLDRRKLAVSEINIGWLAYTSVDSKYILLRVAVRVRGNID